jgi:hypothetical protein
VSIVADQHTGKCRKKRHAEQTERFFQCPTETKNTFQQDSTNQGRIVLLCLFRLSPRRVLWGSTRYNPLSRNRPLGDNGIFSLENCFVLSVMLVTICYYELSGFTISSIMLYVQSIRERGRGRRGERLNIVRYKQAKCLFSMMDSHQFVRFLKLKATSRSCRGDMRSLKLFIVATG